MAARVKKNARKRKAATIKPPVWTNALEASKFIHQVGETHKLALEVCEDYESFCEWLWESRRHSHLIACAPDEGGNTVGWCTLTRMVVLSARIRRSERVPATYSIETNQDYRTLAQMGLRMCTRRVGEFDVADVCMTTRLLCTKWMSSSVWARDYSDTIRLIEMLLYDLGLRTEVLWGLASKPTPELIRLVQETTRAIACMHAVMSFVRLQMGPRTELVDEIHTLIPAEFVPASEDAREVCTSAVKRLSDNMEKLFCDNMRLGNMTEDLCASILVLLSPIDMNARARIVAGVEITDAMSARRRVISTNEYIWDMTKMHELSAADLLNPDEWDGENAWIIYTMAMLRIAGIMISQYNTQLQWTSSCVLFDRDVFKTVSVNGFATTPPLIFIHACRMFVMHGDKFYTCNDVISAFFAWCCIIYNDCDARLATSHGCTYDLKKELAHIFDICCPRSVAQEFSDEEEDDDDGAISDETCEILESLGITSNGAASSVDPTLQADSDGELSDGEAAHRDRVDALFNGPSQSPDAYSGQDSDSEGKNERPYTTPPRRRHEF